MALSLAPFSGASIALLVTNLLGDVKGEHYTDSATCAMEKARSTAEWPDTVVWLFDTANDGTRKPAPFARVQRDGVGPVKYHSL